MNRCRSCRRPCRGDLCPLCRREFDPGDPNGPLRELDEESARARLFFAGSGGETDQWLRESGYE